MSKEWEVTVPIAGHALLTVVADTEDEAIRIGIEEASISMVEDWRPLTSFHEGNVNFCPKPWSAEATLIGDTDD